MKFKSKAKKTKKFTPANGKLVVTGDKSTIFYVEHIEEGCRSGLPILFGEFIENLEKNPDMTFLKNADNINKMYCYNNLSYFEATKKQRKKTIKMLKKIAKEKHLYHTKITKIIENINKKK